MVTRMLLSTEFCLWNVQLFHFGSYQGHRQAQGQTNLLTVGSRCFLQIMLWTRPHSSFIVTVCNSDLFPSVSLADLLTVSVSDLHKLWMHLVEADNKIRFAGRESRLSACQEGRLFFSRCLDRILPIGRIDPNDACCQYSSDEGKKKKKKAYNLITTDV